MHLYLPLYVGGVMVALRTTLFRGQRMGLLRRDPSRTSLRPVHMKYAAQVRRLRELD